MKSKEETLKLEIERLRKVLLSKGVTTKAPTTIVPTDNSLLSQEERLMRQSNPNVVKSDMPGINVKSGLVRSDLGVTPMMVNQWLDRTQREDFDKQKRMAANKLKQEELSKIQQQLDNQRMTNKLMNKLVELGKEKPKKKEVLPPLELEDAIIPEIPKEDVILPEQARIELPAERFSPMRKEITPFIEVMDTTEEETKIENPDDLEDITTIDTLSDVTKPEAPPIEKNSFRKKFTKSIPRTRRTSFKHHSRFPDLESEIDLELEEPEEEETEVGVEDSRLMDLKERLAITEDKLKQSIENISFMEEKVKESELDKHNLLIADKKISKLLEQAAGNEVTIEALNELKRENDVRLKDANSRITELEDDLKLLTKDRAKVERKLNTMEDSAKKLIKKDKEKKELEFRLLGLEKQLEDVLRSKEKAEQSNTDLTVDAISREKFLKEEAANREKRIQDDLTAELRRQKAKKDRLKSQLAESKEDSNLLMKINDEKKKLDTLLRKEIIEKKEIASKLKDKEKQLEDLIFKRVEKKKLKELNLKIMEEEKKKKEEEKKKLNELNLKIMEEEKKKKEEENRSQFYRKKKNPIIPVEKEEESDDDLVFMDANSGDELMFMDADSGDDEAEDIQHQRVLLRDYLRKEYKLGVIPVDKRRRDFINMTPRETVLNIDPNKLVKSVRHRKDGYLKGDIEVILKKLGLPVYASKEYNIENIKNFLDIKPIGKGFKPKVRKRTLNRKSKTLKIKDSVLDNILNKIQ